MSLEGLRAWIGEVERKLDKRTRVFLALTVIAIGIAGASVYLAIDARQDSVSESDVQTLQKELEAQIDEAAAGTSAPAEPVEPTEPAESEPEPEPKSERGGGGARGGIGADSASGDGAGGVAPGGVTDSAKLKELVEQANQQNAEAAEDQARK